MIKTLQKKFVLVAMSAVTVLLFVLLGAINIINIVVTEQQTDKTIHFLAQNNYIPIGDKGKDFQQIPRGNQPDGFVRRDFLEGPMDEDTFMSSRCFRVYLDSGNKIVHTDVSQISSVDETAAQSLAMQMVDSDRFSGKTGNFKFDTVIVDTAFPGSLDYESTMVFLDISQQNRGIMLVLLLSFSLGIVAWGLMFLLVVALSKRAIKPIAENIEQQKRFITDAGHEIKTPLAIIQANADALELHQGVSKWSSNIKAQTVRLGGLMGNLLTLSKMDEGTARIEKNDVNVTGMLKDIADSYTQLAYNRGNTIKLTVPDDLIVHTSFDGLQQCLIILTDNAVKYSAGDSDIFIDARKEGSACVISFVNTCTALPDVEPHKLFQRFYRGDSARTQSGGGYGIGLSVVAAFAESSGGSVTAKYLDNNAIEFTMVI